MLKRIPERPGNAPGAPFKPPEESTASEQSLSSDAGGWRWGERGRAACLHLALSFTIAVAVVAVIYLAWYPAPLAKVSGIGPILLLLLAVDVTLGPLLTLLVFDRRKKSLRFDLACIGLAQVAALTYGLHTVEIGRPHFLVFTVDRFEVVSRADLTAEEIGAAAGNPLAETDLLGPRLVGVQRPDDPEQRRIILFEAAMGGRDLQQWPQYYRGLDEFRDEIRGRSESVDELRRLNPGHDALIDAAILRSGHRLADAGFVPIRGPQAAATMLVDRQSGDVLGMLDLRPWD